MTKQEKIQLEYSVFWEQVKDLTDDFGWIKSSKLHPSNIPNFKLKIEWKFDEGGFYARDKWRPKSLQNLETNNFWSKTENNNFPLINGIYFIIDKENDISVGIWSSENNIPKYWKENILYFKNLVLPDKPVY